MQNKTLSNFLLSFSFLAVASNAQAGVLAASPPVGETPYAAPVPMILSASAVSMLQGPGSYLDSFSIFNAYQNVSGGSLFIVPATNAWDAGPVFVGAVIPPMIAPVVPPPAVPAALPAEFPATFPPAAPAPAELAPIVPPAPDVTPGVPAVEVPEPASFGLLGLGLAGLLMARRRT